MLTKKWAGWLLMNGLGWMFSYFGFVRGDSLAASIATFLIVLTVVCAAFIFATIEFGVPYFFKVARTVPGDLPAGKKLEAAVAGIKQLAINGHKINLVRECLCDVPLIVLLAATGHFVLAVMWAFQLFALFRYRYFYRTALTGLRELHNHMCMDMGQPEKCISEETHSDVIDRMDGTK